MPSGCNIVSRLRDEMESYLIHLYYDCFSSKGKLFTLLCMSE